MTTGFDECWQEMTTSFRILAVLYPVMQQNHT